MRDHMAALPPKQNQDTLELPGPPHVRHDLPPYLYICGDLPRAGL